VTDALHHDTDLQALYLHLRSLPARAAGSH
jgi:hypothetical protein